MFLSWLLTTGSFFDSLNYGSHRIIQYSYVQAQAYDLGVDPEHPVPSSSSSSNHHLLRLSFNNSTITDLLSLLCFWLAFDTF